MVRSPNAPDLASAGSFLRPAFVPHCLVSIRASLAYLDGRPILLPMRKRLPEIILLAFIFLAVGFALMAFIGPVLRLLCWPS